MNRLHLFEFEDQPWFPRLLRDFTTDFLRYSAEESKAVLPDEVIAVLERGISRSETRQIIDLASGAGGVWVKLNRALKIKFPDLKITLTDYYPNLEAFERIGQSEENIDFIASKTDARTAPENLKGLRTQFLSFHHFRPRDARQILQNAVDTQNGIFIFEDQERAFKSILCELYAPIRLLMHTPFIRPFKFSRLIFTYLIPILPFTLLWDGVVSCLRTYSLKEMQNLIEQLHDKSSFDWETGRVDQGMRTILYLLCTPDKTT